MEKPDQIKQSVECKLTFWNGERWLIALLLSNLQRLKLRRQKRTLNVNENNRKFTICWGMR